MVSEQAKNYGKAFLAVYYHGDAALIPAEAYHCWLDFIRQHRELPVCLSMSSVSVKIKEELVANVTKTCGLSVAETTLMSMLYRRRDALLLSEVVRYLCDEAIHTRNEEVWEITSAHPLTSEEQQSLVATITRATTKKVLPRFSVDTSLYAGIKMRSETQYWEKSLAQWLQRIDHFVTNQE